MVSPPESSKPFHINWSIKVMLMFFLYKLLQINKVSSQQNNHTNRGALSDGKSSQIWVLCDYLGCCGFILYSDADAVTDMKPRKWKLDRPTICFL